MKLDDPPPVQAFLEAFPTIIEWVEEERSFGKILLHCTAGESRSPTTAIAYLMTLGETLESAKNQVKTTHPPTWTAGDLETLEHSLDLWQLQLSGDTQRPETVTLQTL